MATEVLGKKTLPTVQGAKSRVEGYLPVECTGVLPWDVWSTGPHPLCQTHTLGRRTGNARSCEGWSSPAGSLWKDTGGTGTEFARRPVKDRTLKNGNQINLTSLAGVYILYFFWEQENTWCSLCLSFWIFSWVFPKSCLSFFPDCLSFLRKSIISCKYGRENVLFMRASRSFCQTLG